jgi:colanic acid/amylovoran biosynthesis glycosyltransferase
MKISYVISSLGLVSETFVTDLIQGLASCGDELTIVCNSRADNASSLPYLIQEVNFLSLTSIVDRISYRFDRVWGLQSDRRSFERQLHHAYRQLLPALVRSPPDVIYVDFGTVAAFVRAVCVKLKIPFVVHFHGADVTSALNSAAYRAELHKVFEDAAALIVASHHIRQLLILEGAPAAKIQVIRLGLNIESLTPLSWQERRVLAPAVVFMGRFTPKKHPVALIEAFALVKERVPTARLTAIGDGSEMPRVVERIERLKLQDAVKLYGELPRSAALPIVNRHWVYAQHSVTAPSGDREGFGISLAEAAALELPIVSTLHNGIPEQVIDGETGFLVKEIDYEAMADCIVRLLLDPALAMQMGRSGRRQISELCQIDKRVQAIHQQLQIASTSRQNSGA